MNFYCVIDRDMAVRHDGKPLTLDDLLAIQKYAQQRLPDDAMPLDLFSESSTGITAMALPDKEMLPEGYTAKPMRLHFFESDDDEVFRISRAKALASWRAMTRYCGKCGTALEEHDTLTARRCPKCGNVIFPRIEPCIITLVSRSDGKILLARHVQRNQNIYACIAGFMEAGETAEQAVAREIKEETGLRVKNIRYFGSQSWPFPSQLMLGFTAELDGGEIHLQEDELSDAQWFDRDNCPASPAPGSIAYRLIHNLITP